MLFYLSHHLVSYIMVSDILDPDGLGASPSKILFRPNSSILAICTDKAGVIHLVDNQDMNNGAVSLEVSTASHHVTYETHAIWGRAYSSDRLFAGTCRDDGHSDGGTVTMFSTVGDASWISDPFSEENGNCQGLALDSQGAIRSATANPMQILSSRKTSSCAFEQLQPR